MQEGSDPALQNGPGYRLAGAPVGHLKSRNRQTETVGGQIEPGARKGFQEVVASRHSFQKPVNRTVLVGLNEEV
jgi:hypothetical protein